MEFIEKLKELREKAWPDREYMKFDNADLDTLLEWGKDSERWRAASAIGFPQELKPVCSASKQEWAVVYNFVAFLGYSPNEAIDKALSAASGGKV